MFHIDLDFFMIIYLIYVVALIIPGIALQIRRMHDINKFGFWILLPFIPIVGAIVFIVFLCKGSVDDYILLSQL